MVYGYVRVSSLDQNEGRQLIAMKNYHILAQNIYLDKLSGKDFERPAYKHLIQRIRPGDLIVVKSIDRLGRNYEEIIDQWKLITKTRGTDICVIDMPLLDTRRDKDLLGTFISDLILQVLSFVSQNERDFIRQRQAEGIAAAKERGIKLGRPISEPSEEIIELVIDWREKRKTAKEVADQLQISPRTFYNYAKKCQQKMQER